MGATLVPAKISAPNLWAWSTAGGKRTRGLPKSVGTPKPRPSPPGGMMPSVDTSLARDDLLLIATLGEYVLPAYALVLLLEKPPNPLWPPKLPLCFALPNPC
jgi:hypothetical protein